MTRFTKTDVEAVLIAIEASAKMQGVLDWNAKLIVAPGPKRIIAVREVAGNLEHIPAPFIPEFDPQDTTFKDMLRALTATLRVLRATEVLLRVDKVVVPAGDDEESPIYWDDFIEDDETLSENPPYEQTARIIDEEAGGVIAYCHIDNADKIVSALRATRSGK